MTNFYAAAIIAMLLFTGCNSSNNQRQEPEQVQPVEPAPEPEPIPEPEEPEVSIPTALIGSIRGDLTCDGGTITTNYSFGNVDEDDKNFVIQYQRNGVLEDLTFPSTSTNGGRTTVKDIYFVRQNDEDRDVSYIVIIAYQTANETYNLVTSTIRQPKCDAEDDNLTAVKTTYEVK